MIQGRKRSVAKRRLFDPMTIRQTFEHHHPENHECPSSTSCYEEPKKQNSQKNCCLNARHIYRFAAISNNRTVNFEADGTPGNSIAWIAVAGDFCRRHRYQDADKH